MKDDSSDGKGHAKDRETKEDNIDYLAAIGMIAERWSTLELHASYIIWKLMNVEKRVGACATGNIGSLAMKMKTLISLAKLRGASEADLYRLNSLFSKLDGLGRQRNRMVHDAWAHDAATGSAQKFTIVVDRKLTFEFEPVSVENLISLRDKIIEKTDDLNFLMEEIYPQLPGFSPLRFDRSPGIRIGRLKPSNAK